MDLGIIYRLEQETGSGKSMLATYFVNLFFEMTTNNFYDEKNDRYHSLGLVFSTTHMFKTDKNPYFRENDFTYTPLGVLPIHLFEKIINEYKLDIPIFCSFDDFDNNGNIMNTFFRKSTDWKRKYNMIMLFIGHYDKDLQKSVRDNSNYRFIVDVSNKNDIVGVLYQFKTLYDEYGKSFRVEIPYDFEIENVFDDLKDMYDTKERVKQANPYSFEKEMVKFCKGMNKEQLSDTLSMFINDQKKFSKELEKFSEILNIY
jgi:hypothetical protein